MDVKLVLLMNCVVLVCCQNTISNRDDTEWQNEFFEDVKSQLESIRQLLLTQQKTDVSNDRQAIQKMKSEIIQEIRQQFLEIDIKSEMASIGQLLINLQQKKSETEEIREIVLKQHGNETQAMQEMKSVIQDIRQNMLKQHGNETQAIQEMKSKTEEIRQIVIKQHGNETQTMQEMKSKTEEIREIVLKQHGNETQAIQEMKSKIEEIRQIVLKQHGNETQAMQEMKSKTEEIRQIVIRQHGNETQAMQDMKSRTEEIRQAVLQQNRPRKGCPPGFDYVPEVGSCITLISEAMTWDAATELCRQMMPGVHLAAITNKDENDAIVRYLQLHSSSNSNCTNSKWPGDGNIIWIGGQTRNPRRCGDPYVWKPLRGVEIPFNYTNWRPNNPDCHESKEHCVQIVTGRNYLWNDGNCDSLSCAICELHV